MYVAISCPWIGVWAAVSACRCHLIKKLASHLIKASLHLLKLLDSQKAGDQAN